MEVSFDLLERTTCLAGEQNTTLDFFARLFADLLVRDTELFFVVILS